jgi:hypothetical protein
MRVKESEIPALSIGIGIILIISAFFTEDDKLVTFLVGIGFIAVSLILSYSNKKIK